MANKYHFYLRFLLINCTKIYKKKKSSVKPFFSADILFSRLTPNLRKINGRGSKSHKKQEIEHCIAIASLM